MPNTEDDVLPFTNPGSLVPALEVDWAPPEKLNCPFEPFLDYICYDRYFYGDAMCSTSFIMYCDAEGESGLFCQYCGSHVYRGIVKRYK